MSIVQVNSSGDLDAAPTPVALSPKLRVIHAVKRWIADGDLAAGDSLPSERALSEQFNVARDTVRAALDALFREGFVGDASGSGRRTRLVLRGSTPGVRETIRNIIVVIGPERQTQTNSSGWLESISLGAQGQIDATGRHALVFNPTRLRERDLDDLLGQGVFGVIVTETSGQPTLSPHILERIVANKVPMAAYGSVGEGTACDRVVSDHQAGAYELTRWLIAQGRKRILMFWPWTPKQSWSRARRAGYEQAMHEAGLEPLPELAVIPFTSPAGETDRRIIHEARTRYFTGYLAPLLLGASPIDALMAPNDGEASMAASCCQLLGLQPHRDVLITGYDNVWADLWERQIQPITPAATVDKRNDESGRELVRLLLDRAQGRLPAQPQIRILPPQLVVIPPSSSPSIRP